MAEHSKTDRIGRVIDAVMKAAEGDYSIRIGPSDQNDDVDLLTEAIDRMISNMRTQLTECRQAEEALRESETKFRILFETMAQGVVFQDSDGKIISANPAAERILGLTMDQMMGLTSFDPRWRSIHEDGTDYPGQEHPAMVALRTGQAVQNSVMGVFHPCDNTHHWILVSATPLFPSGASKPRQVYTTFTDITERTRAEAQILKLNRIYAVLSNINQLIVHERDRQKLFNDACRIAVEDGKFQMSWIGLLDEKTGTIVPAAHAGVTDGYLEQLKFTVADTSEGRGPAGIALREGRNVVCADIERDDRMIPWRERALALGYRSSAAFPLRLATKTIGLISFYSSEVNSFDEKEVRLLGGLAMNLAFALESLEAEEQMRESERKYRELVEHANSIIMRWAPDGRVTFLNEFGQKFFGYSEKEILGQHVMGTIVPESESTGRDLRPLMRRISADPKAFEQNVNENMRRNGERVWIAWTNKTVLDEQGRVKEVLSIGTDVTERKRAEEERAKLESQLLQAQKMESVGRLAGGVAHDFNNMLSVILGYVELIKTRLPLGDPLLTDVLEIEKAASRSRDITRQLLAFSRKQIIAPRPVNLNGSISSTQNSLARLIGEDIDLCFYPEKDLWKIKFDPSQLDQILINLAVNARDAMPGGGKLTVETANVHLDEAFCREHLGFTPGDYVRLGVSDDGAGMNKETLSHVFEPFFTTKEAGKGTGLGLATVYGIVKQNGGFINVYSEPGQGTTFKIYIPRLMEGETAEKIEEAPVTSGAGTVLVVEDDEMVRKMTTAMLKAIGYTVLVAETPQDALVLCERNDTSIDLLLTDVVMPGMSGAELRNKIEAIRPGIRVLFMSGYSSNVIAHRGVLEEGVHFIQKPFGRNDLARKVCDAIGDI